MRADLAMVTLLGWTKRHDRYVLSTGELARILREPRRDRRIEGTIKRLISIGFLTRACRGIYVVTDRCDGHTLEAIAAKQVGIDSSLISFETAASAWGLVTQVVTGLCSCVTTGPSRSYETPWGIARFVHSSLPAAALMEGSVQEPGCPLRMTSKEMTMKLLSKENPEYATLMQEAERGER